MKISDQYKMKLCDIVFPATTSIGPMPRESMTSIAESTGLTRHIV